MWQSYLESRHWNIVTQATALCFHGLHASKQLQWKGSICIKIQLNQEWQHPPSVTLGVMEEVLLRERETPQEGPVGSAEVVHLKNTVNKLEVHVGPLEESPVDQA